MDFQHQQLFFFLYSFLYNFFYILFLCSLSRCVSLFFVHFIQWTHETTFSNQSENVVAAVVIVVAATSDVRVLRNETNWMKMYENAWMNEHREPCTVIHISTYMYDGCTQCMCMYVCNRARINILSDDRNAFLFVFITKYGIPKYVVCVFVIIRNKNHENQQNGRTRAITELNHKKL